MLEGLEAVLAELRQQGNDEAGVEAARQQHADRHVGDRSAFHGDPEVRGPRSAGRPRSAAVSAHGTAPSSNGRATSHRARWCARWRLKLANSEEDRAWRRYNGVEGQVVVDRNRVEVGVDPTAGEEGGNVEAKRSRPGCSVRYSGLIPSRSRARTRRREACSYRAKANMPAKWSTQSVPHHRVGLQDHLGVRMGEKRVPVARSSSARSCLWL